MNLAYRWFCKLGIEDSIPDHSVFCRARHERFRESDALRRVFESVVAKCIRINVLPKRGLALTKCPAEAAIGPARRNPNSPQALPEEFGPP